MRICELIVKNFRGVREGRVRLGKFTVLIGANNSGKTTIVEALALLLGRDRLVRGLTEHDFFGSSPAPGDRIHVYATVTDFEPNDESKHSEWFRDERGVPKWLDARTGLLKALPERAEDKLACQIAFSARFDQETLEVETKRYFLDGDDPRDPFDEATPVTPLPSGIIRDLGFFLVPASRTWDRMISFGSELFRRVVSYVGGKPAEAVVAERERLRQPSQPLENDPKLKDLIGKVNDDINTVFGRRADLKLRLTTTDSEGVLDAVVPHFRDVAGHLIPSRRQGNGLISYQTLVLLMRFGEARVANKEGFLMAVEEPELHVPPALQRKLLHLLQRLTTQTIITTHSPTVGAVPDASSLLLVINRDGSVEALPLSAAPLPRTASNWQRSLLLRDRESTVSAVMHPHVLVPEGKTDFGWIRLFSRVMNLAEAEEPARGPSFDHLVGVVSTSDAKVVEVYEHLRNAHPSVTCLVDGDAPGSEYRDRLVALKAPPSVVVQLPSGWFMEHLVGWIVEAEPAVLGNAEMRFAGIPSDPKTLVELLCRNTNAGGLKTDEIAHALIADAISGSQACVTRVDAFLAFLRAACINHGAPPRTATVTASPSKTSVIWTFNHGAVDRV